MQSDDLILGIDGGGTKTVVWLALRGRSAAVIGRGLGGPSNIQAVGVDSMLQHLDAAVDAAFHEAGIAADQVLAAVVGLAGSDRQQNRDVVERWAARRKLARRFLLINDALPVLAAGSPSGWGAALICGTGSFCFGRAADGQTARAGGWGFLLGDEGSGYALALAGLRAAAKAADGRGPHTQLLPAFLDHLTLHQADQLVESIYVLASDQAAVASLAPLVARTASQGDAVARQIVCDAAEELAEMVGAVARALGFSSSPFPLVLAGSLLLGTERLREHLLVRLAQRQLTPDPINSVAEPVAGCLALARALVHEGDGAMG